MDPLSSGREGRDREVLASRAVCATPGFHALSVPVTDGGRKGILNLFATQAKRDLMDIMDTLSAMLRSLEGYPTGVYTAQPCSLNPVIECY